MNEGSSTEEKPKRGSSAATPSASASSSPSGSGGDSSSSRGRGSTSGGRGRHHAGRGTSAGTGRGHRHRGRPRGAGGGGGRGGGRGGRLNSKGGGGGPRRGRSPSKDRHRCGDGKNKNSAAEKDADAPPELRNGVVEERLSNSETAGAGAVVTNRGGRSDSAARKETAKNKKRVASGRGRDRSPAGSRGGRGRGGRSVAGGGGGRGGRGGRRGRGGAGRGGGGIGGRTPHGGPAPSEDDAEEEVTAISAEQLLPSDLLSDETENNTVKETAEDEAAAVVPTSDPLSLEKEPPGSSSNKGAVPLILSRQSHPTDYESHAQLLSESLAMAALEEEEQENEARQHKEQDAEQPKEATQGGRGSGKVFAVDPELLSGKKKRSKKKKKSKQREAVPEDKEEEPSAEIEPVSATDALKALPAQEVSITATTQVKILRNESSVSLSNRSDATPTKIIPDGPKSKKKSKKKGGKGLSSDDKANQRAARKFNNEVRLCVERSDPDSMREILQDRRNHKFALDHMVLETVMKAYIMAAMFEDALYCLRNCVLPGTLSTLQTERILTCLPQNLRSSNAYTAADMINALCIATQFDAPTHLTYFLRIVRGIALEFLEEAMSARDRICSAPCERLVRSGLCVVDARLKRGKKPADLLVIPGDQLGVWQAETVDNRGIQAGDAVSILPYAGPYPLSAESLDRNMIEATVTNTQPMVLRLQDKANANLHAFLTEEAEGNVYRIDKLANRMGFNRQLSAAVAIASPMGDSPVRDTRRPCPQLIKAITAMDENIDINLVMHKEEVSSAKGGTLAAIAANSKTTTAAICAQAIPWNVADESDDMDQDAMRHASRLALEKYGALEGLNASQQLAVEGAVTNRLTLIQGPPGSGKTEICIRILQHWARLNAANAEKGETPSPIVATSDSNIAVDNLVEGCANVGLRVVRLGRPEAIRPELLRYCIDRPPSSYDKSNGNGASASYYGSSSSSAASYKERMKQLKNAQVVCCTCIGSGGDILDSLGPLDRILVDEATQATEPAVLVPLMRGCRQLVLVGDHCQLPPTVLSTRAEEEGHGVPLFSRLVACGVPPYMLDTQYRMHPCIAMFPSDLFYGGLLKTGVSAPERRPLAGFPWPREEFPVAFIPVKGVEMDDGVSKFNEAEAAAACEAVTFLLQGGQCTVSDIAVVTPYAAQARLIRRMTRRLTNATGPPYIEVSSVDGFQGREKEAVVFSAVRSNDYGAIGFTSDWRRINVSFTRARRALIVIGNDQTLRRGDPETWMPWLAWADAHGLNMDKPGVPRGRYEPEQLRRVRGGTTAAEMLKDVLARQQEQVKDAERQQERAVKNAEGHILAAADDEEGGGTSTPKQLTLEEDVALLEKAEGNWDDSDDDWEDKPMVHSASRNTLTSATSSNLASGVESESSAADVWDL